MVKTGYFPIKKLNRFVYFKVVVDSFFSPSVEEDATVRMPFFNDNFIHEVHVKEKNTDHEKIFHSLAI